MSKAALILGVLVLVAAAVIAWRRYASPAPTGVASPLDFTLTALDGSPYPLTQHRGKVVLLVNTASRCGFTPQYAALQQLWTTYRERGLVVIGVPSNDFLFQEPGTAGDIQEFCQLNFGVTFPLMSKVAVTGIARAPLYTYLTRESAKAGAITWNFTKFLVGRDGRVIDRFGPSVAPDAAEMVTAIEAALTSTPRG